MKTLLVVALLAAGCGDDGGTTGAIDAPVGDDDALTVDASSIDAPQGVFALTSPMLVEGAAFAADNTCTGANTSPQLAWTAAPAGTQSFAIVFTDMSNDLIHWVIYDIPAAASGLPAAVDKAYAPANVAGAHQTASYQAAVRGYLGPCPPVQHTYELELYALDVAALPGATMQTTRMQAEAAILQHQLASATLTGTYQQP